MGGQPKSAATKRYIRRIWSAAFIYASPLILKIFLPAAIARLPWVHVLLLGLPMIGMVGFFHAMHRLIVELSDEYQRHVMIEIYQLTTWLVLTIATIVGFLQFDKYLGLVSLTVVPIAWFACFGVASGWVRWRESRQDGSH